MVKINKCISVSLIAIIFCMSVFVLVPARTVSAASTIGTNILTTGTFEGQNTASAAFFLTGNTIQVGGYASVAYSRFGTSATTHSDFLSTTNDLLINGDFEVDGKAFFDGTASVSSNFEVGGTASISGVFTLGDGQIRPRENSGTAFRFQNAAGDMSVLTIDTTNRRVGIGGAPATTFEVQGTASASYFLTTNTIQAGALFTTATVAYSRFGAGTTGYSTYVDAADDLLITGAFEVDGKAFFDGTASVSGTFEAMGTASSSNAFVSRNLVVGSNVASSSSVYTAEFGGFNTATVSVLFGGDNSSNGTCFQVKNTAGAWRYMRVVGSTLTVDAKDCSGI